MKNFSGAQQSEEVYTSIFILTEFILLLSSKYIINSESVLKFNASSNT